MQAGKSIDLGGLKSDPAALMTLPKGLNDAGDVVGAANTDAGPFHAFLFRHGHMTDLGVLPGHFYSSAYAIDEARHAAGESCGWFDATSLACQAVVFRDGTIVELGTLVAGGGSSARALNASDVAAGEATVGANGTHSEWHAVVFRDGTVRDLGVARSGDVSSQARGINAGGTVVGVSSAADIYDTVAFVARSGDATMVDLNSLIPPASGWKLVDAAAINDRGEITGQGVIDGQWHAYRAIPVAPR